MIEEEGDAHYETIDTDEDSHDTVMDDSPARISVYVTSTTNPNRPRTIRAGYDFKRMVMTVVFFDGTWWNYYGVERAEWQGFKESPSKGRWLHQNGYNNRDVGTSAGQMGPAGIGSISTNMMRSLAKSRAAQQALGGAKFGGRKVQSNKLNSARIAAKTRYLKGLGKA